jgi:hypothetical protein
VTQKIAADVLLIATGVGVLVVCLLAAEAAVWLMGFPIGWTEIADSETPSHHKPPSGSAGV